MPVVSAFGTLPGEVLFPVFEARRSRRRPSLAYRGDDGQAKEPAARLIRDAGFDPVDACPLPAARYLEPSTLLIARLAYEDKGRPTLAHHVVRFEDRE